MSSRLRNIIDNARGALAASVVMRSPTGPILSKALHDLMQLERQGYASRAMVDRAFAQLTAQLAEERKDVPTRAPSGELARAHHHLSLASQRAKKPTKIGAGIMSSQHTDLPAELSAYSDGVSDDAAYHPEIIGCGEGCEVSGLGDLTVAGLGDLTVAGLPGYLFTKKNLSNPVLRRRVSAAIKGMSPKLRRRVLGRLRQAVSVARVSGAIRNVTPGIAGDGWAAVSGAQHHHVSIGRCPYANVAGALTP